MIGIKVQNLIWERGLLDLLGDRAEKYQENQTYDIIICDKYLPDKCLVLGKDISLPFRFEALEENMIQIQCPEFENNTFKWLSQTRQLLHKRSQKLIQLTEKESDIIGFLAQRPNHQATKEEILQSVWHYQNDVHTHTLESHIYALRQKLAPDGEKLLTVNNGVYKLSL